MVYVIKGYDDLASFSGSYSKEEVQAVLTKAIECSSCLNEFDQLIEGRLNQGYLLSGSQLLASLDINNNG